MKKRLVFEYDDAVEMPWSLSAFFIGRKTDKIVLRNGRIEDEEPEKPEPEKPEPEKPEPLKPCPFCGGEAQMSPPVNDGPDDPCDFLNLWQVSCCSCDGTGGSGETQQQARAAWNRRAS